MDKIILHSDFDNFFASVECVLNPKLKDIPIAVIGDPEKRHGIILAKNQLAKICGVKTGETIYDAKKKCPNITFVAPHREKYVEYSNWVKTLYYRHTDKIEAFGMDECWLDATESQSLLGNGFDIANLIQKTVKHETGLTVSIGVSFTKTFSKIASDMNKPNGLTVIDRSNYKTKIWDLPIRQLFYVGEKTAQKLNSININTIKDLAIANENILKQHLGINGIKLKHTALGLNDDAVQLYKDRPTAKTVGHGTTTYKNMTEYSDIKTVIYSLSELVATRLRRYGLHAGGVQIGVKDCYLSVFTRQTALPFSTQSSGVIAETAFDIFKKNYDLVRHPPVRAISVTTYNLTPAPAESQFDVFSTIEKNDKLETLDKTIDTIRSRFGFGAITRAGFIGNSFALDTFSENDEILPFFRG